MNRKLAISLLVGIFLSVPNTAEATTTHGTVGINGGALSLQNTPTDILFPGFTVDGHHWMTTAADIPTLRVQDGRGTGEGWSLTVSATQIQEVGGLGLLLPRGSLRMYGPSALTVASETDSSPYPTITPGYQAIDDAPFTIASAASGEGIGTYDLSFSPGALEVSVDPGVKVVDRIHYPTTATPYETTITWTLNHAP